MTIREKRTYRTDGWDTFEEYCQERWGWTRQRAYRLIDLDVIGDLSSRLDVAPPTTEFQARPLAHPTTRISDPQACRMREMKASAVSRSPCA